MDEKQRCACGRGEPRADTEQVSVSLPRCGVVASVLVPASRCSGCGELRVEDADRACALLSIACELADRGVCSGDVLRLMRRALGLRAVDLARMLDLTPETISHWETGKSLPARAAFAAVAAMVAEAVVGDTATRDRLAALAVGEECPRALDVRMRDRRRRGVPRVRPI